MTPEERAQHEKAFFDQEYQQFGTSSLDVNPDWFAKYRTPHDMADWRQNAARLLGDVGGRRLLDYGCGIGEETTYFALLGAEVYATEVSETALTFAERRVRQNGVADRVKFYHVEGIRLAFEDNYFDLIHGLGVLHHVSLEALTEIRRVLKPGGKAVFLEHMGSSKRLVPLLRRLLGVSNDDYSETERPLDFREVQRAGVTFSKCEVHPYHLTYRLRRFFPPGFIFLCYNWITYFSKRSLF